MKYNLVAIEPVKGQPGKALCRVTAFGESLMSAIKGVQQDGANGVLFVEAQSYDRTVSDYRLKHRVKEVGHDDYHSNLSLQVQEPVLSMSMRLA